MILDKEYKDFYYMRGSIQQQQQQQQQRKGTKVVIWTPFCAAKTCSYISLVGTLFLVRFSYFLCCVVLCDIVISM
jgi:hypothetical protein